MKNENGSSRLDTVLKMLLIAFISLLAFSSGVYFGKQMSDSDYQLKALEGDFNHAKKTAENSKSEQQDEALAEEEVAQLTDKYMKGEKQGSEEAGAEATERNVASTNEGHGEKVAEKTAGHDSHEAAATAAPATKTAHGEEPTASHTAQVSHGEEARGTVHGAHGGTVAKTAEKTIGKPDLSAAHQAADRVAMNHAPTEAPKVHADSTRTPSSLPKIVGPGNDIEFTVQVASYPTAETAKEHAAELVKKGFPAFPVEASIGGRVWYRVSVGSFKTMKEATAYRAQLLKQAELPSAIVQRIQR